MSAPCPLFGAIVRAAPRLNADAGSLYQRFNEVLASRGLACAGSAGAMWNLVVSSEAGQMTEADRQAVVQWLEAERAFASATVTELGDLR